MAEKKLRRYRRTELIEMLYYLKKENDELKKDNEQLGSRLDALIAAIGNKSTAEKHIPEEEKEGGSK